MKLGAIKEPRILSERSERGGGGNKSEICQRFILAVRISGAKAMGTSAAAERTRKEEGREKETVGSAFGKKCLRCTRGRVRQSRRVHAEQFRGNVCRINRERETERGTRKTQGQERGRVRKMGKGMYARWNSKVENFTVRGKERNRGGGRGEQFSL